MSKNRMPLTATSGEQPARPRPRAARRQGCEGQHEPPQLRGRRPSKADVPRPDHGDQQGGHQHARPRARRTRAHGGMPTPRSPAAIGRRARPRAGCPSVDGDAVEGAELHADARPPGVPDARGRRRSAGRGSALVCRIPVAADVHVEISRQCMSWVERRHAASAVSARRPRPGGRRRRKRPAHRDGGRRRPERQCGSPRVSRRAPRGPPRRSPRRAHYAPDDSASSTAPAVRTATGAETASSMNGEQGAATRQHDAGPAARRQAPPRPSRERDPHACPSVPASWLDRPAPTKGSPMTAGRLRDPTPSRRDPFEPSRPRP